MVTWPLVPRNHDNIGGLNGSYAIRTTLEANIEKRKEENNLLMTKEGLTLSHHQYFTHGAAASTIQLVMDITIPMGKADSQTCGSLFFTELPTCQKSTSDGRDHNFNIIN